MGRFWTGWGAVNAFLAVAAGAFGAHALKAQLSERYLAVFETAARYHLFHALGLLAIGSLAAQGLDVDRAGWAMLIGIVLFSGSLYALALSGVDKLGIVTPFGGLAFLVSWALVAYAAFKK